MTDTLIRTGSLPISEIGALRRDMELIRKMVLLIEDHPHGEAPPINIDGYTRGQLGYHAHRLIEQGLAVGRSIRDGGDTGPNSIIYNLTPAGHDFAESIRNEYIWDQIANELEDKGLVSMGSTSSRRWPTSTSGIGSRWISELKLARELKLGR
jgi:hypothetical protein